VGQDTTVNLNNEASTASGPRRNSHKHSHAYGLLGRNAPQALDNLNNHDYWPREYIIDQQKADPDLVDVRIWLERQVRPEFKDHFYKFTESEGLLATI
jgi:hypothetical protein